MHKIAIKLMQIYQSKKKAAAILFSQDAIQYCNMLCLYAEIYENANLQLF